ISKFRLDMKLRFNICNVFDYIVNLVQKGKRYSDLKPRQANIVHTTFILYVKKYIDEIQDEIAYGNNCVSVPEYIHSCDTYMLFHAANYECTLMQAIDICIGAR